MAGQGYWRKRSEVRGSGTCWVTKGARRIERKRSRMSEPHRKRPDKEKPMGKGKQEALEQGAESTKAAQKHMGKERQNAKRAQEVL